jgi:hypothetical protein
MGVVVLKLGVHWRKNLELKQASLTGAGGVSSAIVGCPDLLVFLGDLSRGKRSEITE